MSDSRTLNTRCSDTTGTRQSCSWPQRGSVRSTNAGASGNCTWGAYAQWKQRTGSYPALAGNAEDWNTSAESVGWRVSRVPHRRSIVVFEQGVAGATSLGHVAYVTDVYPRGSGTFDIGIIEMNFRGNGGGGPGVFSTRTVRHQTGMSYIVSTI